MKARLFAALLFALWMAAAGQSPEPAAVQTGGNWRELANEGYRLMMEVGDYRGAERAYSIALDQAQRAGVKASALAHLWSDLGVIYTKQSKFEQAEQALERAFALLNSDAAPEKSLRAVLVLNLAEVKRARGLLVEAERAVRDVLADLSSSAAENPTLLASALNSLAAVLLETERLTEAEGVCRQMLTLRPQPGLERARASGRLGVTLSALGRFLEAEQALNEAIALFENALPERHPEVAQHYTALAGVKYQTGRYAEAEALHRKVLDIYAEALPDGHPLTVSDHQKTYFSEHQSAPATSSAPQARSSVPMNSKRCKVS